MRAIRQILAPLRVAFARLRVRRGQTGVVVAGVAASAAAAALLLGGSLVARDRAFASALAAVPAADRTIQVAYFGVPAQGGDFRRSLDVPVRQAFAAHLAAAPVRALLYRRTRIDGVLVNLGAVDRMERWVRLRSGRFPQPCSPERCEVVRIGEVAPVRSIPGLELVSVGRGELVSPLPFGRLLPAMAGSTLASYGLSPEVPPSLLLAEGVSAASGLRALESIYRSYSWVVPLRPGSLHVWEHDALSAAVTRARSELEARSPLFDLTAPTEELAAAVDRGSTAGVRLLLIGGQVVALLLVFAVLGGVALRRETESAWQRLTWLGARRWQLALLPAADALAVAIVGTALGWALASALVPLLADRAGSPGGDVLARSLLSTGGLAAAAGVAALAATAVLVSLRIPVVRLGSRSVSALDVAALGAAGAVALALVRGRLEPGELTREPGGATLLLLLPGLVALVAGVTVARTLPPALRALQRSAGAASVAARLAFVSVARSHGRAAVAVSFVVVSVGLAVFAASYRWTLLRGQEDQARFAFPLDVVLREDLRPSRLVPPLRAAPLGRYRALGGGVRVVPVIRLRGSVSRLAGSRRVIVLGVPAADLPTLQGWREDFSSLPLAELGRRLASAGPVALRGPVIPAGARSLLVPARTRGSSVALGAAVLSRRGDVVGLDFGELHGGERRLLSVRVPSAARGGKVVALRLGLTRASQESGGPDRGLLSLGQLAVRTQAGAVLPIVSGYRGWVGVNGVTVRARGVLRYVVTNQVESLFRPAQPSAGEAVPVLTTPGLASAAGPGGILPLQLARGALRARVVATANHFPSVSGAESDAFVVADAGRLFAALNADAPGSAAPNEIWLGVPPARAGAVEQALRRPPFDVLEVASRRTLEARLASDPLARAALVVLAVAAVATLAVSLMGLLLLAVADLRDERDQLFDLEAEGADPALLRRHVRLRVGIIATAGLAGGLVLGAVLAALTTDVVAVTAGGDLPEPPLLLDVEWTPLGVGLAAYVVAAALVGALPSWRAFRSPTAARVQGG